MLINVVDKRLDKSEIYFDVGYINVWMLDRRLADKPTVTNSDTKHVDNG